MSPSAPSNGIEVPTVPCGTPAWAETGAEASVGVEEEDAITEGVNVGVDRSDGAGETAYVEVDQADGDGAEVEAYVNGVPTRETDEP